jgi:hypothetical protein
MTTKPEPEEYLSYHELQRRRDEHPELGGRYGGEALGKIISELKDLKLPANSPWHDRLPDEPTISTVTETEGGK